MPYPKKWRSKLLMLPPAATMLAYNIWRDLFINFFFNERTFKYQTWFHFLVHVLLCPVRLVFKFLFWILIFTSTHRLLVQHSNVLGTLKALTEFGLSISDFTYLASEDVEMQRSKRVPC